MKPVHFIRQTEAAAKRHTLHEMKVCRENSALSIFRRQSTDWKNIKKQLRLLAITPQRDRENRNQVHKGRQSDFTRQALTFLL